MAGIVLSNLKSSDKHNKKSLYFSQVFPLHSALYFASGALAIVFGRRPDLMSKRPERHWNSMAC